MTTHSSQPAIVASGLRKSFAKQPVLDGLALHVPEGTIYAVLGPNGAGKTTMVQILATAIAADSPGGYSLSRAAPTLVRIRCPAW